MTKPVISVAVEKSCNINRDLLQTGLLFTLEDTGSWLA